MKQHGEGVEEVQKKSDDEEHPGEEQRRFSDRTSFRMNRLASLRDRTQGTSLVSIPLSRS